MKKNKYLKTFEMFYTDIYGKGFDEFYKKYKPLAKDEDLYVQFTDYKSTKEDKTVNENPDHSDFVGNYGYPLKYVIDYPADIWYGSKSKYLRVLRNKDKYNELVFNYIDKEDLNVYLRELYPDYSTLAIINMIKRKFPNRIQGGNKEGKILLQAIQYDLIEDRLRSGLEQTNLLKNINFGVVIDKSKSENTAIINDREPEQICFLYEDSFDVLDVYNLHDRKVDSLITNNPNQKDFMKKIANKIINGIDSSDVVTDTRNDNGIFIFYTKKGKKIELVYLLPDEYYKVNKIGRKRHRVYKKHNDYYLQIKLHFPYGYLSYVSSPDEKIDDIIKKVVSEYKSKSYIKTEDKFHSLEIDKQKEEKQKKEYWRKEKEKENNEALKGMKVFKTNFQKMFGNFEFHPNDNDNIDFYKFFDYIAYTKIKKVDKKELIDYLEEMYNEPIMDSSLFVFFGEKDEKKAKEFIRLMIDYFESNFPKDTFRFYVDFVNL